MGDSHCTSCRGCLAVKLRFKVPILPLRNAMRAIAGLVRLGLPDWLLYALCKALGFCNVFGLFFSSPTDLFCCSNKAYFTSHIDFITRPEHLSTCAILSIDLVSRGNTIVPHKLTRSNLVFRPRFLSRAIFVHIVQNNTQTALSILHDAFSLLLNLCLGRREHER